MRVNRTKMKDSTEKIPEMRKQAHIWSHQIKAAIKGNLIEFTLLKGKHNMYINTEFFMNPHTNT